MHVWMDPFPQPASAKVGTLPKHKQLVTHAACAPRNTKISIGLKPHDRESVSRINIDVDNRRINIVHERIAIAIQVER